ncbi:MAG: hypothetical protein HC887_04960 [Desulfobacteraceae bacterium]|nr:hypothetical protein [Desulfobacteraceae bacterium]
MMNESYCENHNLLREMFVRLLYRILQTVKIHRENNQMVVESCEKFIILIRKLSSTQNNLTLQVMRGKLYIDEEKLLYRRENITLYDQMTAYLERRGLQGLRFYQNHLKEDDNRQILNAAVALNDSKHQKNPYEWLNLRLKEYGVSWLSIITPEIIDRKQRQDKSGRLLKTYSYALASVEEIVNKLSVQNRAGIGKPAGCSEHG